MLRPEASLLLALSRLRLEPAHRSDAMAILRQELDWPQFVELAARHGVAPLMERHLASMGWVGVPKPVAAALWARNAVTVRRNRGMATELATVYDALEREGIETIPYKGPTLALAVYGDLSLREFGDLDLLLRARDVPRAKAILGTRGYDAANPLPSALEAQLLRTRHLYELPLVDRARGLMVELHWRPDPDVEAVALGDDDWWRSLPTARFEGTTLRSLQPHELLLVLCLHGSKHFWVSLGWLVDVAELIRSRADLDWQWIAETARRLRCRRRVALGLRLAHEMLQAALNDAALSMTADPTVEAIARRIQRDAFAPGFAGYSVREAFRMNLRLSDDRASQVHRFVQAVLTPGWGEWHEWQLPSALFFLYYPLRLIRLFRKYLWRTPQAILPRHPESLAAATPHTPPPPPHWRG
jgi:hypothetical protein